MESYNPKEIESKWQKYWAEHPELYSAREDSDKPKKYILDMFPYPSGEGLHVGHVESYTATDIVSRYFRMNGFNVLHPQGWDAFGLPAENYAIKTGTHPTITTQRNIANFTRQIKSLGMSYDWLRKINTSDTEYYKWTQWFFLLLYKNGLAYKKKGKVNWCPSCQTVLAHEQVEDGVCERCKNEVVQKDLEQWYFKITDFIEKNNNTSGLLEGLEKVDWPESIKLAQRNWIGRSEGVQFKFRVIPASEPESKEILNQIQNDNYIEVFTTRLDTVFGVTYVVVAPENPILESLKEKISNWDEVEKYIFESKKKSDLDRMEEKEKTGVEIKGVKAINPFNGEEVPIFVGDYVLGHYGTGAVMAVPAHDERDFEFARKYNLLIKKAIDARRSYVVTIKESLGGKFYDEVKKFSQLTEKDGLIRIFTEEIDRVFDLAEKYFIGAPWYIHSEGLIKKILFHGESGNNRFEWEKDFEAAYNHGLNIGIKNEQLDWKSPYEATTEDGILVDSGEFSGLSSEEAREKMTRWLEEKEIGKRRVNYKLRDWLVSRQRYWGAPIPIIYCEKCGMQPVPESDLPVVLPDDVDFKPTGESPLVYSKKFHDVKCPTCGGSARRESDTMDTFVCSSWYYFRYSDPKNDQEFASREKIVKWLPVDTYVGGAEHAVLHLLYARFFTKVLHNLGIIDFDEPFLKLRNQGLILAEDGRKMSKSLGNVVNPDQVVEEFGADSLRMFEMFMGPLEDAKPWQTQGIVGIKRFLEKVYRLSNKVRMESESGANKKLESLLHKTIKKVSEDIENFRFNTAISSLMILTNEMEKEEKLPVASYELLIALLSPFAPHIAEELWNKLGRAESIFREKWPRYDPELIKEEEIELVVQISGKMRAKIKTKADISEDEAKELALSSGRVKSFLDGREIKKIIFVQGKLINIVV